MLLHENQYVRKKFPFTVRKLICAKISTNKVWFFRYGVQQAKCFVILGRFLPFYPITTRKIKIFKNSKKVLEISSFYTSVPKITIICYTVPQIWHVTDLIVILHFGLFFTLTAQKIIIQKKWKKTLEILSICNSVPKMMIICYTVPEI